MVVSILINSSQSVILDRPERIASAIFKTWSVLCINNVQYSVCGGVGGSCVL